MARLMRRQLLMILTAGTTMIPLYRIGTPVLAQDEEQGPEAEAPAESTPPLSQNADVSGGLGLRRAEWESKYGKPTGRAVDGMMAYQYEGRKIYAKYHSSGLLTQTVREVERTYDNLVSLEVAKTEAMTFAPSDSSYIRTYDVLLRQSSGVAEQFFSNWIIPKLTENDGVGNPWPSGQPGDITAVYRLEKDNLIRVISIRSGNYAE
jgi:hypothetical protein